MQVKHDQEVSDHQSRHLNLEKKLEEMEATVAKLKHCHHLATLSLNQTTEDRNRTISNLEDKLRGYEQAKHVRTKEQSAEIGQIFSRHQALSDELLVWEEILEEQLLGNPERQIEPCHLVPEGLMKELYWEIGKPQIDGF